MRWPWVARSAFEEVARQRDQLEAQVTQLLDRMSALTDQLTRIQRVAIGMPEERRERKPVEPLPPDLQAEIMATPSREIRAHQLRTAYRWYTELGSWDAVRQRLEAQRTDATDEET